MDKDMINPAPTGRIKGLLFRTTKGTSVTGRPPANPTATSGGESSIKQTYYYKSVVIKEPTTLLVPKDSARETHSAQSSPSQLPLSESHHNDRSSSPETGKCHFPNSPLVSERIDAKSAPNPDQGVPKTIAWSWKWKLGCSILIIPLISWFHAYYSAPNATISNVTASNDTTTFNTTEDCAGLSQNDWLDTVKPRPGQLFPKINHYLTIALPPGFDKSYLKNYYTFDDLEQIEFELLLQNIIYAAGQVTKVESNLSEHAVIPWWQAFNALVTRLDNQKNRHDKQNHPDKTLNIRNQQASITSYICATRAFADTFVAHQRRLSSIVMTMIGSVDQSKSAWIEFQDRFKELFKKYKDAMATVERSAPYKLGFVSMVDHKEKLEVLTLALSKTLIFTRMKTSNCETLTDALVAFRQRLTESISDIEINRGAFDSRLTNTYIEKTETVIRYFVTQFMNELKRAMEELDSSILELEDTSPRLEMRSNRAIRLPGGNWCGPICEGFLGFS